MWLCHPCARRRPAIAEIFAVVGLLARCRFYLIVQDKESLLFQKGQEQERIKELTSLCEQQRARLADSGQRLREAEKAVSTVKKESKLAGKQVRVSGAAPEVSRRPRYVKQLQPAQLFIV